MTPTSLGHDLTRRDKGNGKDHRSVEQAAADYRNSMKYVEANEEAIMRKWKAGWACNKRKEREVSLIKSLPAEIVSALILKVVSVDPRAEGRREEIEIRSKA